MKNPYAKFLKKQVTLRLNVDVVDYFKKLADETGIPYQNLINLYLQDGTRSKKKLKLNVLKIVRQLLNLDFLEACFI